MPSKTERKQYALYIPANTGIKIERQYGAHGTIALGIVEVSTNDAGREIIRNPRSDEDGFADLQFHAQWDANKPAESTYAWECEYHGVSTVGYRRAETMLATLKRVRKAEEFKTSVRPATFGQYVVLVAQALGIQRVAIVAADSPSHSYADMDYRLDTITRAQHLLDWQIETARARDAKEHGKESELTYPPA